MKYILGLFLFFSLGLFIVGCGGDDGSGQNVVEPNAVDDFTKLVITLTNPNTNQETVLTYDEEVSGGGGGFIQMLNSGVNYNVAVTVLDSTKEPEKDLNELIRDENASYQLFFVFSEIDAAFTYEDEDRNNKPVGLTGTFTANETSFEARIRVILISSPDKDASGVEAGNPANAGGEIEIDADFTIVIE